MERKRTIDIQETVTYETKLQIERIAHLFSQSYIEHHREGFRAENGAFAKSIEIIGDSFFDNYAYCSSKASPETGSLILSHHKWNSRYGGVVNVANALCGFPVNLRLYTLEQLDRSILEASEIFPRKSFYSFEKILCFPEAIKKTRLMSKNHEHFRLDQGEDKYLEFCSNHRGLIDGLLAKRVDGKIILLCDYHKGFIAPSTIRSLVYEYNEKQKGSWFIYDAKHISPELDDIFRLIRGNRFVLRCNEEELYQSTRIRSIDEAIKELILRTGSSWVVVTRSSQTPIVGKYEHHRLTICRLEIEGYEDWLSEQEIKSVSGAGDYFIAMLAFQLTQSDNDNRVFEEMVISAHLAATINCSNPKEMGLFPREIFSRMGWSKSKILLWNDPRSRDEFKNLIRNQWKTEVVGYTNGVFDLFHIGHMKFLKEISKKTTKLAVLINDDASVKLLKNRIPVIGAIERAEMLSLLPWIDLVIIFPERDVADVYKQMFEMNRSQPLGDHYKGSEYANKQAVLSLPYFESIQFIPEFGITHTSKILETIFTTQRDPQKEK